MSCNIVVPVQGKVHDTVMKIQALAQQYRAEFSGDDNAGTFSGYGITGNYSIDVPTMMATINITHHPFFLTCNQIQDRIINFLSKQ